MLMDGFFSLLSDGCFSYLVEAFAVQGFYEV